MPLSSNLSRSATQISTGVSVFDNNLFRTNLSYYFKTNNSQVGELFYDQINTTSQNHIISTLFGADGIYVFRMNGVDDHTALSIEDATILKTTNSLDFTMDWGDNVRITLISSPLLSQYKETSYEKFTDRYKFSFGSDSLKDSVTPVSHTFRITSRDPIHYRQSRYKNHFITGNTWLDFEPYNRGTINRISPTTVDLIITTTDGKLSFSSLGGLNEVQEDAEVLFDQTPVVLTSFAKNTTATAEDETVGFTLTGVDATSGIDTVLFNIDGVNVTTTNTTSEYLYIFTCSSNNTGVFSQAWANDSVGNIVFNDTGLTYACDLPLPFVGGDVSGSNTEFSSVSQAIFFIFLIGLWVVFLLLTVFGRGKRGKTIQLFNFGQVFLGISSGLSFIPFSFIVGFIVMMIAIGVFLALILEND